MISVPVLALNDIYYLPSPPLSLAALPYVIHAIATSSDGLLHACMLRVGRALPYPLEDLRPLPASLNASTVLASEGDNYHW